MKVTIISVFSVFPKESEYQIDKEANLKLATYIKDGYEIVANTPLSTSNSAGVEYVLVKKDTII